MSENYYLDSKHIDDEHNSQLHDYAITGNLEMLKFHPETLRENPNIENDLGYTLLHLALENEQKEVVYLLLSQENINVNVQTEDGLTPIMIAIMKGYTDIVSILLNRNDLDINLETDDRLNAINLIMESGNTEMISNLIDFFIKNNSLEDVKSLIKNYPDFINMTDETGYTLLMNVMKKGDNEIVDFLAQKSDFYKNIYCMIKHKETYQVYLMFQNFNLNLDDLNFILDYTEKIIEEDKEEREEIIRILETKKWNCEKIIREKFDNPLEEKSIKGLLYAINELEKEYNYKIDFLIEFLEEDGILDNFEDREIKFLYDLDRSSVAINNLGNGIIRPLNDEMLESALKRSKSYSEGFLSK